LKYWDLNPSSRLTFKLQKAKMHQIVCPLALRPDPVGGAYSAPSPDPLAGF